MKKPSDFIVMNSSSNKVANVILTLVSILAGAWLVVVLLSRAFGVKDKSEDLRLIQQEEVEHPITRVVIPDKTQQLGTVIRGDTLFVSFLIKNTGAETLYIDNVHPDCTCAGYNLDQEEVPAGEQTMLSLTIDTTHKYGPQQINAVMDCNSEEGFHILKVVFDVIEP